MSGVKRLVAAARVMEEGEQLNHEGVGARERGQPSPCLSHSGPVTDPVNAVQGQPVLAQHRIDEGPCDGHDCSVVRPGSDVRGSSQTP